MSSGFFSDKELEKEFMTDLERIKFREAETNITQGEEYQLNKLAERYLRLRAEKFKQEGELKYIEEQLAETNDILVERLKVLERTRFDFRGKDMYQHVDNFPQIIAGQDFALFDWLDARGEGGIAKRSIHNKTLPSWYRRNVSGDKKAPPLHPEWEEELTQYLETFQKVTINVRGDDRDAHKTRAYEDFKEIWK